MDLDDWQEHGTRPGTDAEREAVPFAVDVQLLAGTFTWEVEGDRVVFHQVAGGNRNIWAAELLSETSMSGAWVGWAGATHGVSTTFTAEKE